jgi:DNA-binding transcriptional MerR regulator
MSATTTPKPKTKKRQNNGAKTSPETAAARERAAKAMDLRKQGFTFDEIAVALGYTSRQRAHEAVMRMLKEIIREPAEELRTLELERLDAMFVVHFAKASKGSVDSLGAALRIMERRAKLMGIDQAKPAGDDDAPLPVKVDVLVKNARVRHADA